MATRIDGKAIAAQVRSEVAEEVSAFKAAHGRAPGLTVVLAGDDQASAVYVRNKEKAAAEVGMKGEVLRLPASVSQQELLDVVLKLNADPTVDGILVQLPIPDGLDEKPILEAIDPRKDVDGFHMVNVGALWSGLPGLVPCTPSGCMRLLSEAGANLKGANAVVVGRSNIVGKPMAALLLREHATVTIAHSRTQDLPALCREADILVAAVGRAKMVKQDWVKPGAVVIDVGMNRDENGKLCGDVDYADVEAVAGAITPVPGGVGPMTIAMLMKNTLSAARAIEAAKK
ncbi:MAG: bifunctional methylenetetrahydrofolate dehydrogenase/methenyltetrahydrofolate cyclohydrolase FolD [Myxococcales bacterium]|nr:bifunctional methylenetetrahydrofolate dehydrogenase/methenyltetrahydrofolate cyclohydrolase FolD [Myxococcales bacterium]MCB9608388.1 bifunctional methylenetetrahydrofolate dehydrogenase/methenyltetrahydrofolate cyclohydrolase FolD [Polyangiaceae bacterium]